MLRVMLEEEAAEMQKGTVSQTTGIQSACSCANNIDMCSLTFMSTVCIDTQNL